MKGVILSVNPKATIVDITHGIDPQDVIQAAYRIESAWKYFSPGTVHVVVIDPGVGSSRDIIALKHSGHIFIAPDNGVLTRLIETGGSDEAVWVENTGYFLDSVSRTFHGRDIFAPVSAHLTLGVEMSALGPPVDLDRLVHLSIPKPRRRKPGEIVGIVVNVDHFGNLMTNIDSDLIPSNYPESTEALEIQIGKNKIAGIATHYGSVEQGHPLAIIGSRGYLEIAVNRGNAAHRFNSNVGDTVYVVLRGSKRLDKFDR
jgi:S-adenosylmethionine hydrolase